MPPGADAVAQARALLGQLRTLAAQHEQVLAAYERQLDVITAGGASKLAQSKPGGALPNKRPLLPEPEGPEAKKQRMVAEQQQRRNALWHECYKVLDRCRRNQKAEAFKKPVDFIRLKIPDYPLLIKNPMDLQTVGEKLKLRVYKEPGEFASDMRLIWDNAVAYNGRTHVVGQAALAMSEFFEKAWGPLQIEKAWAIQLQQEELAREALQGNVDGLPNSDLPRQLKEKRDMLGHYIAARDYNDGAAPGALGPCEPGRGMNFEEKRKLSAHLASLPGEKMQRVVDIVEAGMTLPEGESELEVDIDALPDAVLWQLKEYVDAVLAPPAAPPNKGGVTKGAASKAPDKRPPKKAGTPGGVGGTPAVARGGTPAAGTPPPSGSAQQQVLPAPVAKGPAAPQPSPFQQHQQQTAPAQAGAAAGTPGQQAQAAEVKAEPAAAAGAAAVAPDSSAPAGNAAATRPAAAPEQDAAGAAGAAVDAPAATGSAAAEGDAAGAGDDAVWDEPPAAAGEGAAEVKAEQPAAPAENGQREQTPPQQQGEHQEERQAGEPQQEQGQAREEATEAAAEQHQEPEAPQQQQQNGSEGGAPAPLAEGAGAAASDDPLSEDAEPQAMDADEGAAVEAAVADAAAAAAGGEGGEGGADEGRDAGDDAPAGDTQQAGGEGGEAPAADQEMTDN